MFARQMKNMRKYPTRELYTICFRRYGAPIPALPDCVKTLGQCSITAFLAQDIFGGEVYGILRSGGNYHCYNVVGDCIFDLTSEQFGDEVLCYEGNPIQSRRVHFAKEEKRLRYEYLKRRLEEKLGI